MWRLLCVLSLARPQQRALQCVVVGGALVLAGCSEAPVEADRVGRTPADVVLAAYGAAIAGDYEKANSYGTEAFVKHELLHRDAIERGESNANSPGAAWPSRVFGIGNPGQLKIERVQRSKAYPNIIIVSLRMPVGVQNVDLIKQDDTWKHATSEDRQAK